MEAGLVLAVVRGEEYDGARAVIFKEEVDDQWTYV